MEMLGTTGFKVSKQSDFKEVTTGVGTSYKRTLAKNGTIVQINQFKDSLPTKTIIKTNGETIVNTANRFISFYNPSQNKGYTPPVETFFSSPSMAKQVKKMFNKPNLTQEVQLFLRNPSETGRKKMFPNIYSIKNLGLSKELKAFSKSIPNHLIYLLDSIKLKNVHGRWFA